MTKQFHDLFAQFSKMDNSEQIEKVREIRHRRSIERPKVAKKRQKREKKKSLKAKDKFAELTKGMTDEQKQILANQLKAMQGGKEG